MPKQKQIEQKKNTDQTTIIKTVDNIIVYS